MKKVFITGVSGTGKTTIANTLNAKGLYTISLDETPNLCFWKNKTTGEKIEREVELNETFINAHDWICDINLLVKLMNTDKEIIFVLGVAANQKEFMYLFDKTIVLQCTPATLIKRLTERKDNDFGKDPTAQALVLSWYKEFEEDLIDKGAIPINTEASIKDVADTIIKIA